MTGPQERQSCFCFSGIRQRSWYVNRPEKIEEIRQAIRETVRKDVEVEILLSDGADRRGLADIPVEELLREAVRMPVEIEEDPDEDELNNRRIIVWQREVDSPEECPEI